MPDVSFPEVISPLRALHRELAIFGMIAPTLLSESSSRIFEVRGLQGPWSRPPLVYLTETLLVPGARVFLMPAELRYAHKKWDAYRRVLHGRPEGTPRDWAAVRKLVDTVPSVPCT
jgi:hypothetical protein